MATALPPVHPLLPTAAAAQAFASGLMEYGMMTGVKAPAVEVPRSGAAGQELSNGNGKKADIDVLVAV